MWMNEFDVEDAVHRYGTHDVLGPAVMTLQSLMTWTNGHSDGWAYWQKPSAAAKKLQEVIRQHDYWDRDIRHLENPTEATAAAVKEALRPIKAFRTRQGADFVIYETWDDIRAEVARRLAANEAAERAELARLEAKYK